ncbi:MAG TPA: YggS family pyridoxal phosphate-dependent enzyme [Lacipirellulaceae bacterium]|nr:YggS family pyridoxal phosphate-dependent enzyme [Lacipirellulaceae bacterium]
MSIADNLRRVRERIARAAEAAGRSPNEIKLVGVTKYVGPQQAAELAAAGCLDLGESRPQELWKKAAALTTLRAEECTGRTDAFALSVRWHLIGHLQRNKVARTLPLVTLIHSVDNQHLLAAINEAAGTLPVPLGEGRGEGALHNPTRANVLLEVNTSGETAKHGLAPDDVEPLLATAPNYPHIAIHGLMTMAALEGGQSVAAKNFHSLRQLRDRLKRTVPTCVSLNELSMGMSADFEVAIKEGATIVRIGSALWDV